MSDPSGSRVSRRPPSGDAEGPLLPPAQRTRSDLHLKGGILRIKLHNFLTFDDVTVRPSPGLNVVLGPNGTGKSSIVCALCLGLAGNPGLLGRAREIKYFVKHGKRSGYVELDLFNGESSRPITIRRSISAENNRSDWTLNGVTAKEQQISEIVKQFNIQLGNHCQFLPQDMVVKFAAMNSYDLLEASEKAIGRSNMYEDHQKLKDFGRTIAALENSLQQRKTNHVDLKQKNDLISTDVERFRNRENFLQEVDCLKKKKYWMEYREAREAFSQCKTERKNRDLELRKLKDRLKPYEDEKHRKEVAVEECRQRVVSLRKRQTSLAHQVAQHRSKLQELEDQVDQPRQELKEKQKEEEGRLKRLEDLQKEIDGFERELGEIDDEIAQTQSEGSEGLNARLKEIHLSNLELRSHVEKNHEAMAQLEFERDGLTAQLRRKKDEANRRLQYLQQQNRDTYEAIMWLRSNQHRFKYPIIEPILLVTNCKTRKYMPQVESVIRGRDMFSFVARCKPDMHLFMTEVHDKMHLRVNGVTAPDRPPEDFRPDLPFEKLRRHHFQCMLLDHIDAPPPVLSYLCNKYNIHNIPIAGELSAAEIEEFEKSLPRSVTFMRYFTDSTEFSVQRSRFASHMISRSKEIRKPEFMMFQVNQDDTEGLKAEIDAKDDQIKQHQKEVEQLMGKQAVLRQEDAELRKVKNQIQAIRHRRKQLYTNIQTRKTKIEQLSNSAIDLEAEEQRCMAEVVAVQRKRVSAVAKRAVLLTEYVDLCERLAVGVVQQTQSSLERDVLVKRCRESEEELRHMESVCSDLKNRETSLKEAAVQLLHKARKETNVNEPDDLPLELKQKFDTYPDTLVEIDERMHEFQVKADLCAGIDPRVVHEYKSREQEIDQLGREIERMEAEVEQKSSELEVVKRTWLNPLRELVAAVNEKFSCYFSQMGCAGQVRLNEHDTDFSLYGVEIMVKFRDSESLQLLTSTRQSGGERSVSTMLYLLALQDLTNCPFRAVDEINQGMDPVNERKVFNLIVDAVSGLSTAQYFLFTPKLLHSLNFTRNVTVHLINNGPEMLEFHDNQVERFLKNRP